MDVEPRVDNFTQVKPSRKQLRPGDVFAIHYDWLDGYILGRVIKPKATPDGETGIMAGSTLIYIYAGIRKNKDLPDEGHFWTANLLIPPMFVNRTPWSRAGVETIGNVTLSDDQVLNPHCFQELFGHKLYWDGEGNQLDGPIEPVGGLGLRNIRSIDLHISRALGLPEPTALYRKPKIEAVTLIDDEDGGWVSVLLNAEAPDVLALGQLINDRFDEAYMNGYNWEAVVTRYVKQVDPDLLPQLEMDPEAGMLAVAIKHSATNLAKMRQLETHIRTMLGDDAELISFIEQHRSEIQWD